MKQKIAKILLHLILLMVVVSYLPWVYMTMAYYVMRYAIMACVLLAVCLTFSLERYCSPRFMRLLLLTIVVVGIEFLFLYLFHKHFRWQDLTQLIVVFLCTGLGTCLDYTPKQWANICFYFTLGLAAMVMANCFYYAGGLYVPEYYLVNEGKNQMGGLLALGAASLFFWGVKREEHRGSFIALFALSLLLLILIRARADFFALLACVLFVAIKEVKITPKIDAKVIVGIVCFLMAGYILYNGFLKDELTRFMVGGHGSSNMEQVTTHRWERNKQGIDFVSEHAIVGEQDDTSGISLIHNYPLLRMVRYGLFALPMLAFYLFFIGHVAYHLFKDRRTKVRDVGYVVCMVPLIVSFFEPNFPYGPGTVQMLGFLLLGATLCWNQMPDEERVPPKDGFVLHICNDFSNSHVHAELYKELDAQGVEQIVYTPVRNANLIDRNRFEAPHTRFVYSYILRPWHRIFFHRKIDKIVKDVERQGDLNAVSCIHATTLFSDGAVAYRLKQRYGIPFMVAVRNTDVNDFMRYMPHLWWVHRAVLQSASRVVCIAPALHRDLMRHFSLLGMRQQLTSKMETICNGINAFWLQNLSLNENQHKKNHHILYVGNFTPNKNVLRLSEAVLSLQGQLPDIQLHLVGEGGSQEPVLKALQQQHPDVISWHGPEFDKQRLQHFYQDCSVFAMPSLTETFGLVYLEALSQGLSVLYTKGEGIDGLFSEKVGEAVNARKTEAIAQALASLLTRPGNYETLTAAHFEQFYWEKIAQHYAGLYRTIVSYC